jgi:predicted porin
MTLLGVGSAAGSLAGNTTTLGRIGTGFMYADWKSQVAYTSPNFNGFNFTVGLTQAWNAVGNGSATVASTSASSTGRGGSSTAYEGKASYAWTGDVAGKVWTSFISQKVEGLTVINGAGATVAAANVDDRANAWDIGTTVNVAGLGLTAYYGQGDGIGQTLQLNGGFDAAGKSRDSDQWYVQATYAIPTGTKLGLSYGESTLDGNSGEAFNEIEDSMTVFGAYHPITKHLNLVAEYAVSERDIDNVAADAKAKAKTISLGAILFF